MSHFLNLIYDETCKCFGFDISKKTQERDYVLARACYYKLALKYTQLDKEEIGAKADRDRVTVINATKKVNADIKQFKELRDNYEVLDRYLYLLTNEIKGVPVGRYDFEKRVREMEQKLENIELELKLKK